MRGKERFKISKNRPIFCIEKIKIAFSQKFSKVWFDSFFLWLPIYKTFNIWLRKFMIQERCGGRDARVAWGKDITCELIISCVMSVPVHSLSCVMFHQCDILVCPLYIPYQLSSVMFCQCDIPVCPLYIPIP